MVRQILVVALAMPIAIPAVAMGFCAEIAIRAFRTGRDAVDVVIKWADD